MLYGVFERSVGQFAVHENASRYKWLGSDSIRTDKPLEALNRIEQQRYRQARYPRRCDAGIFPDPTSGRKLFQDHLRERMDVGLQHDEQADKTSQRDRMLEDEAQDRAFMAVPVGG